MSDCKPSAAIVLNSTDQSAREELPTDFTESSSGLSLSSPYLSRPSKDTSEAAVSPSGSSQRVPLASRKDRLYIGNIHPTVDE
jgi:hypothetical protein